ncbi:MAG TPA: hypothetical protein VKQ30_20645 [Ktedonobacterales bacterium]|nr:hypothetical protein [Ktedonobacterales bacterium]
MELFSLVEDEHAILKSKGVYRQAKLYRRGEKLFAGFGNGYVRLHPEHVTSKPDVKWHDISVDTGKNGFKL